MAKNTDLRAIREKLGLSQAELVRRVREESGGGFTQQSLSKLERNPGAESKYWIYIQRVLDRSGVSLEGDGAGRDQVREGAPSYWPELVRVPVIGEGAFGEDGCCPALEDTAEGEETLVWPTEDAAAYALKIQGDALRPRLKHGEYVVVEPGREPVPGDEVLVKTDQHEYRMQEYLYERNGRTYFHSLNQDTGRGITSLPRKKLSQLHYVAGIVKSPIH